MEKSDEDGKKTPGCDLKAVLDAQALLLASERLKDFDLSTVHPDDQEKYGQLIAALKEYKNAGTHANIPFLRKEDLVESARKPTQPRWYKRFSRARVDALFDLGGDSSREGQSAVSVDRLVKAVDWVPSPKTRKLLSKVVSDQVAHIRQLESTGRIKTAKWQLCTSWGLLAWYGVLHTVSSVFKAVRGKIAG